MQRDLTPTPSEVSVTPSAVQATLSCIYEDCLIKFTGQYRRGNLHRHIRISHNKVRYPCGVSGCEKIFNRQDARLNHHRKKHVSDLPLLSTPFPRKHQKLRRDV
ncbi:hypothetical protein SVAN01_08793 [Stagonosporopsis vannaccii]|nr:hypothetical protein SVAN01_08793 [Stagonosporopsis vannaccii]